MTTELNLTGIAAYLTPSAECDLIMKGGISSGIVYPRAACQLATKYRFRRLGGASAGAIAAAAAAASEHGRESGGFVKLEEVPNDLGGHLADLFQPSPATKPAFAALSAWLDPEWSKGRKLRTTVALVIRQAPILFGVALALLLLPGFVVSVTSHGPPQDVPDWLGLLIASLVWLPAAVLLALVLATAIAVVRILRALPRNGFGLCDGHSADSEVGHAPLTDWLCNTLDSLAGHGNGDGPLTFGHLWGEKAVALERAIAEKDEQKAHVNIEERLKARAERAVDLEVMTTNLTFRRPYRFPFDTRIFHFCEKRMRTYFPDDVVDHLVKTSAEAVDKTDTIGATQVPIPMRCTCHDEQVRSLPSPWDLPVVLAARLSLSFPGLISAIPLFCVDWSRSPGNRRLIEVWFSDGGISSNFPMHFFDAPWPMRPTFGINLSPPHPDYPSLVWKPQQQGSGGIVPRSHSITSMPSFLSSILDTMQNWVDTTQITMPGFRDRIAVVRQGPGEGGMNLKMPEPIITSLANRGAEAAELFDDFDFDLHRWIRYRVAMSEIDGMLGGMHLNYTDGFEKFVDEYRPTAPKYQLGGQLAITQDQTATSKLMRLAEQWTNAGHPSSAGLVPRPKPVLRIVPRQ